MIDCLTGLILAERTAASQYTSQWAETKFRGYAKLAKHYKKEAEEEYGHLSRLLYRMSFFDGIPPMGEELSYSHLTDIQAMLESDLELERNAVEKYSEAIDLATKNSDHATRAILEEILKDEDEAVQWLEGQIIQLKEVGIENYRAGWV